MKDKPAEAYTAKVFIPRIVGSQGGVTRLRETQGQVEMGEDQNCIQKDPMRCNTATRLKELIGHARRSTGRQNIHGRGDGDWK